MDLWTRARVFAEAAAKRSQEISAEAAKRSQEFVSETAKKSRELAVEATKKADQIKIEAIRRADQIKTLAGEIPIPPIPTLPHGPPAEPSAEELDRFGVTEELREYIKGISMSTFRDFQMEDELPLSEIPTVSNVRQDLNEWQAKHATVVLSAVKEISKFRYELCPRHMKERKFWRIYFVLVNNFVVPYEKQYMEEINRKTVEREQNDVAKEIPTSAPASQVEVKQTKLQSKTSTSSTAEQDLDLFLLGDLGSSDEGPDDGDDGDDDLDDDFDKGGPNQGSDSEDDEKKSKK